MSLTIEQFTERLASSSVMSDEELREWLDKLPANKRPTDGEQLARELVKRKRLTAYQALEIYLGKGQSLVLGNYVVLDKLGEGGMGLVLKAEHRRMRRVVALKVLSSDALKARGAIQRFEREVQAAARLEHPNIVAAYDADQAGETNFLVMQYVDGEDLSAIVKKSGPLPVDRAVDCILQAARGLEFAHQNGVIHRDIKPHNLLLGKDGVVKILDMGLARIDDPLGAPKETTLTSTGAVLGTIDYMSPEQAEDTKTADARSDVYSLGCTLFYLLTGKVPYPGETMMKRLLAHRDAPIPSLPDLLSGQERGSKSRKQCASDATSDGRLRVLDQTFRKMLAKRPEDRHASMTEVIADLQRCLTAPVAKAAPVTVPSEDSKLNEFLVMISDPDYSHDSENSGNKTSILPDAEIVPAADAQTVDFQGDSSDTNPSTLTSARAAAKKLRQRPWWRDRTKLSLSITAAILVPFIIWLAIPKPVVPVKHDAKREEKKPEERTSIKRKNVSVVDSDSGWQSGENGENLPQVNGWRDLFKGDDLNQWTVAAGKRSSWTVSEGQLHHRGNQPGWLATLNEFSDFELSLEFRVEEGAKGGVLLRADRDASSTIPGIEIQLIDDHNLPNDTRRENWTGAISFLQEPSVRASRPINQWQQLDVVCRGNRLVVLINRTQVVDMDLQKLSSQADKVPALNRPSGLIGLQAHTGRVDFRKIRIRPLRPGDQPSLIKR